LLIYRPTCKSGKKEEKDVGSFIGKDEKNWKVMGERKVAVWQDGRVVVDLIVKFLSDGHSFNITNINQTFNAWDFEEISENIKSTHEISEP